MFSELVIVSITKPLHLCISRRRQQKAHNGKISKVPLNEPTLHPRLRVYFSECALPSRMPTYSVKRNDHATQIRRRRLFRHKNPKPVGQLSDTTKTTLGCVVKRPAQSISQMWRHL